MYKAISLRYYDITHVVISDTPQKDKISFSKDLYTLSYYTKHIFNGNGLGLLILDDYVHPILATPDLDFGLQTDTDVIFNTLNKNIKDTTGSWAKDELPHLNTYIYTFTDRYFNKTEYITTVEYKYIFDFIK